MDIKKQINKNIAAIERKNVGRTKSYKARLKAELKDNIVVKGQTPAQNQGLINRFYNAKPQGLSTMQLALQEATREL